MQKSRNYEEETKEYQRKLFGERFVGASLANFSCHGQTSQRILRWMNNKKYMLVFCGSPGIGKTRLCASLIEWALRSFSSFRYFNERQLLQTIRSTVDDMKGGDYLQNLNYLIDDPLVILDDLGSSRLTDWGVEVLFDAVDQRYNTMLPTVITSNLNREEFTEIFHERFSSRLFDKENTIIEIHDGVDKRIN